MAFNKVILLGNLTADPETRTTPSGQSVTSFSLAINRTWNDGQGNRQEATSFINCTAWGARGETMAKYLGRGRQVLVSGRLEQRTWDDKETGKKRSAIDVIVEEFSFVNDRGGNSDGGSAPASTSSRASSSKSAPKEDVVIDDIPEDEPIDLSEIPF